MKSIFLLCCFALFSTGCASYQPTITLSAEAGAFERTQLGEMGTHARIACKIEPTMQ